MICLNRCPYNQVQYTLNGIMLTADQVVQKMQQNNVFTIAKRNVEGQDMLYQSLKLTNNVWVLNELKIQPGNPDVAVRTRNLLVPWISTIMFIKLNHFYSYHWNLAPSKLHPEFFNLTTPFFTPELPRLRKYKKKTKKNDRRFLANILATRWKVWIVKLRRREMHIGFHTRRIKNLKLFTKKCTLLVNKYSAEVLSDSREFQYI